ncbi:MAG: Cd2+/Zn2+-exporting ATPase [Chlamydiales bacterium]|jgi:Cd2+/Zn2+-exporting ATPase
MTSNSIGKIHNPPQTESFDEFFHSGFDETASPFITLRSRHWGNSLTLKASFTAGFLLFISFILSNTPNTVALSNALLVQVYFLTGIPSLITAIKNILKAKINIEVLMTLAAFLSVFIGSGIEGGLLLVLFSLSGAIESHVATKAKSSLNTLNELSPSKATVISGKDKLLERSVKDITVGTKILIKAGEVVALDGEVLTGASSVSLVHLTGENLPVPKAPGDEIPAGSRNLEGTLTLRVTRTSNHSTLANIIRLITQAQEARPKLQRWLDKVGGIYSSSIIFLTTALAITLPFILGINYLGPDGSIYRSIAFLITASPCALIIAVPIAYLSTISACAKQGILLKGGFILDALAGCSTIAFDKTGTLTTGKLKLTQVTKLNGQASASETDEALAIALTLERSTIHPIARSIVDYVENKGITPAQIQNFKAIPGYGLEGTAILDRGEVEVKIGHPVFISSKLEKTLSSSLMQKSDEIHRDGNGLAVLLVGDQIFLIHFSDSLRANTKDLIHKLQSEDNLNILMLSGDHPSSVKKIAQAIGITDYHADLRPNDKLEYVSKISQENGLIMVGDGMNDAPALARSTVGVSMGQLGNSATVEISDVVLLQDDLEKLPWLIRRSRLTQKIVFQNVVIAGSAIIFASIAALLGVIPLWLAVILHEGGTVIVGLNSLRLLRR